MEAQAIKFLVNDQAYYAERKRFRTGSVGYFYSGKVYVEGVKHQLQIQLVEVKSRLAGTPPGEHAAGSTPHLDSTVEIGGVTLFTGPTPPVDPPVAKVDIASAPIRPSPGGGDTTLPPAPEVPEKRSGKRRKARE